MWIYNGIYNRIWNALSIRLHSVTLLARQAAPTTVIIVIYLKNIVVKLPQSIDDKGTLIIEVMHFDVWA